MRARFEFLKFADGNIFGGKVYVVNTEGCGTKGYVNKVLGFINGVKGNCGMIVGLFSF